MFLKRKNSLQQKTAYTRPESVHGIGYESTMAKGSKWQGHEVIYNSPIDQYSIAIGEIEGKPRCAIRWNGDSESDSQKGEMGIVGTPSPGGGPFWFILPDFLAETVVQRVIDRNNSKELRLLFPSRTDNTE